ncbi:MAG: class I SAM-dependent rRNA methyltransferase [Ardenticatenaceae bacterium]
MNAKLPTLTLPHFLKPSLAAGHPWVYRDHVPKKFRAPDGTWVKIKAGNWSAYALWDASSPIALRVFSQRRPPDAKWVMDRVQAAWELRALIREQQDTTAYRWLFGEADGLPGLTVDLYGSYAVLITYATALKAIVPWVVEALPRVAPLKGIVQRIAVSDKSSHKIKPLWGRIPPRNLIVQEHGLRLRANLHQGQKTGLFLDHRENRRYVERLTSAKEVLNLFSYSGAFSLYAARGGAIQTVNVDISPGAASDARENFILNGFDPDAHEFVVADVFDYLEKLRLQKRRFDLVICDPPSFARNKQQRPQALKAYARLNAMAMRVTEPGGLYATASCTSQVSPDAFRTLLADAARQAGRRFQLIHDAAHPPDHPILAQHKEGRYLKFVVGRAHSIW